MCLRYYLLFPFLPLLLSTGCGSDQLAYADQNPQIYRLQTRASLIDTRAKEYPKINFVFDSDGKHQDTESAIVDTRVTPRGKLVIWLMGPKPELFDRLASYGMHAINVHYARGWFNQLSGLNDADTEHIGNIRLEAATGEDYSAYINIEKQDGLMERSYQFVKWLANNHPEGKWDYYLTQDGQGLRWEDIIVSGSSHGSTTAARFAKHVKVSRVVMFSGPRDQTQTWQSLPSETPINRYFGFTHVQDAGWPDHYERSWEMLGLNELGAIVNVDMEKPPYSGSHQLITAADVGNDANRAHGASSPGNSSPKDEEGRFIYEDVWEYLFTYPGE